MPSMTQESTSASVICSFVVLTHNTGALRLIVVFCDVSRLSA